MVEEENKIEIDWAKQFILIIIPVEIKEISSFLYT